MRLNEMCREERIRVMRQELDRFMVSLKPSISQSFNPQLQNNLIESLLDGTVFQIVDSLRDLQEMNEKQLYADRQKRLAELQLVPDLDEQMKRIDMNIVCELDKVLTIFYFFQLSHIIEKSYFQIMAQQQNVLSRAGVPAFRVTNNPNEITLQMEIIRFILTLTSTYS
ncbi:unnamed protein product [Anisakis simplex]|uniref:Gonadal protein gdl n=1 Tax=Anisakis simplex TaxID=6269 RepID=A0A0M3IZH7_ANISI|nr:unnamed protein product [Anisakis simplex]